MSERSKPSKRPTTMKRSVAACTTGPDRRAVGVDSAPHASNITRLKRCPREALNAAESSADAMCNEPMDVMSTIAR